MKVLSKRELRDKVRGLRKGLSAEEHKNLSQRVLENIKNSGILERAHVTLAFCPFDGEPDISPLFDYLMENGKVLVLPKVVGSSMKLCQVRPPKVLEAGRFCILEPAECEEVQPDKLDLALVPGVAFDKKGRRLGMGKGYYDRILGRLGAFKVGVAFSFQVLEDIPCDPWDQGVDAVITEEGIFYRR